ncbi:hypothetical protein JCM10450v2_007434 [Rhodotorula kratochvilovae]
MSWTTPPSTSSGYTYGAGYTWGAGADGSFSSSWVTWVSVVVVAGVVVALLCSRYFYIRRFYSPTLRAYFIPAKGVHIPWLRLHIAGPPERIPREPPPSYSAAARRRRRRGRQTAGETVGEGGRRVGDRDADDGWDDLSLAERGSVVGVAVDELPRYYVDSGLPGYFGGDGDAADEAERIRVEAATAGESSVIPSAAEYEAASRAARDPNAPPEALPAYPPAAHLSPPGAPDVPRPAAMRSSTARSSLLLSAFRRAPSPQPFALAPAVPATGAEDALPRASTSSSSLDSTTSSHDAHPGLRRSASTSSGSSDATKLDASTSTAASMKGKKADDEGEGADASSSRVKLDDDGTEKPLQEGKGGDA